MQLQHYIWLLRRKFWLILLGVLVCTGATAAITFVKAPTYEASTTIEVNAPGNDIFGNQALAVSYALQVTSEDVFQEVARVLPGVTVAQLQNAVSASTVDQTALIEIWADAPTAEQAAAIANAVAQTFIKQKLASENARQQAILDQLSSQLTQTKTQMDKDQRQVDLLEQENASDAELQRANAALANDQSTYESLFTNYNTVQMQKAMLSDSLIIEQRATPPAQPSGTSRSLAIALAAVMSLMLMLLVVFLLDWMDVTIKTTEDVGQLARLNALGSIPLQSGTVDLTPLLLNEESRDELEPIFAVISTNLQAVYKGQRALLVTGLRRGSGTSTTAIRLAFDLAQSGLRVLLVDANLRHPSLHKTFQVVNTKGLLNSLADAMAIQEQPAQIDNWLAKWTTAVPNLWLLPGGQANISPLTVLRSLELRKMVNWLLQKPERTSGSSRRTGPAIDLVIFDTPALLEEADALALALLCDSAVLVVDAARERKETLKKAESMLARLGAPILGVVINRKKSTHHAYLYTGQSDLSTASPTAIMPGKYPLLEASASSSLMEDPSKATTHALIAEELPRKEEEQVTTRLPREGNGSSIPRRPHHTTLSPVTESRSNEL
ncbi:MAG TPA: Wzz/FepE/Etk N-terminal domain-containing protein [Ktedonobacteraceae bacterium]|nr:Wzz/FepE/Etk N-terminal domain-containing protein [Ktedonobacteraceae bacterium]